MIDTICGVGSATSARPVSRLPVTTLTVAAGRNSLAISASSSEDDGVESLGFRTTALPAASAGASFQIAIIIG